MKDDVPLPRLLFVHAHPDDETLATGVALAHYALAGHDVHLLTCTLGDEGEVIPPELAHLAVTRDNRLGPYRRGELRRAMSHLGVNEQVLGEDPRTEQGALYRDSGMAGAPSNRDPRALIAAPSRSVAHAIRAVIKEIGPDIVVTYDKTGGYEHPDHIRVHKATVTAVAALSSKSRPALYAAVLPRSWGTEDRAWVRAAAKGVPGVIVPGKSSAYPSCIVADDLPTHHVIGSRKVLTARDTALREHRTQVTVHDGFYTLSNAIAARLVTREAYIRLDPETGKPKKTKGSPKQGLRPPKRLGW